MVQRPIMDAGPGINFFSLHKERMLFSVLGGLAIPETVRNEIHRKSVQDQRFESAVRVMNKIPAKYLEVLSDDVTEDLARAVQRISNMPMEQRKKAGKDLGETMVVAHAAVAAEHGENVIILIDDSDGRKIATAEDNRLVRLRAQGKGVGRISLVGTLTVLRSAVANNHIPDKAALRDLYTRFRLVDDGLPPLPASGLLDPELWA